ncbi:hypothetical protein RchiOBHm_Chr7g0183011 [Rosa chinensis]|uniref:AIPP2-like SPOC-like domain-containing protein n=1 Tax=Rosa chinensis TaxID=74649 RepID=A0A2P6P338_ROSCH|nr:hypothetical protein RchiOBHm_Chr7g0183011 [Rosa chinensis]
MPNVLPCTMLSCCNVWEEIFQNEIPTIEDIAVFFFPGNFERSKEQYFSLVQVMETQDLILRSLIKGVNLLILSSKRLHLEFRNVLCEIL